MQLTILTQWMISQEKLLIVYTKWMRDEQCGQLSHCGKTYQYERLSLYDKTSQYEWVFRHEKIARP